MKYLAGAALILTAASTHAADNPMWKTGLVWSCQVSSVVECERLRDCTARPIHGAIELDYRENHVIDQAGIRRPIKRHYAQTVSGSPISSEVKVEFETNEVLWLSPVDGAGTFSDNWVGVMLSPKTGVIIEELRPLVCKPDR